MSTAIPTTSRKTKVFPGPAEALADVTDGIALMSGGFGLCGIPENSIDELVRKGVRDLHAISNNIGNSGRGLALLLKNRQISRATCSFVGGNPDLEEQMLSGVVQVTLVPQGTFSERIRAAGMGIRGFYTPTGYATLVAEGKEVRQFDRPCLLELPLEADFAIITAERGDVYGNLWFKETARNFSPLMAMAAKVAVVEVEELVPLGGIAPEDVHLPGIFVQRIYQGRNYRNDIEIPVYADGPATG
jgi:3-oxoacid CoA-transferase subunit A